MPVVAVSRQQAHSQPPIARVQRLGFPAQVWLSLVIKLIASATHSGDVAAIGQYTSEAQDSLQPALQNCLLQAQRIAERQHDQRDCAFTHATPEAQESARVQMFRDSQFMTDYRPHHPASLQAHRLCQRSRHEDRYRADMLDTAHAKLGDRGKHKLSSDLTSCHTYYILSWSSRICNMQYAYYVIMRDSQTCVWIKQVQHNPCWSNALTGSER